MFHLGSRKLDLAGIFPAWVNINNALGRFPTSQLQYQLRGPLKRWYSELRADPSFKAHGSLATQLQIPGSAPDTYRIEVGRLQQY